MSREDDIKNLLVEHNRRLQKLKEQQARKGIDTQPHILTDIEAELERIVRRYLGPDFHFEP